MPGSHSTAQLPLIERRDAEILHRYEAGENLASVSEALELTRECIRQIVRSLVDHPWLGAYTRGPRSTHLRGCNRA